MIGTTLFTIAVIATLAASGPAAAPTADQPAHQPLVFNPVGRQVIAEGPRYEHANFYAEFTTYPAITDRAIADLTAHTVATVRSRPPFDNEVYAAFWESTSLPDFFKTDQRTTHKDGERRVRTEWQIPAADQIVAQALVRELLSAYAETAAARMGDEICELEAKRAEYEQQVETPKREYNRLKQAWTDLRIGTDSSELVTARLDELQAELRRTEIDLAELEGQVKSIESRLAEIQSGDLLVTLAPYRIELTVQRDGKLARKSLIEERIARYHDWQRLVHESRAPAAEWRELSGKIKGATESIDDLKARLDILAAEGVRVDGGSVSLTSVYKK